FDVLRVFEDIGELFGELVELGFAQTKARQASHVRDFVAGQTLGHDHGIYLRDFWIPSLSCLRRRRANTSFSPHRGSTPCAPSATSITTGSSLRRSPSGPTS